MSRTRISGWKDSEEGHMSKAVRKYGVLCDTGFLIRLN